jgi:hypothetical protein
MDRTELGLPILSPRPGGLTRLQRAVAHPSARGAGLRRAALASASACGLVLMLSLLPGSNREEAFAHAIDQVLQDASQPVALQVSGYAVQSDRRLDNGSRVFELSRQSMGAPSGREPGGGV